MQASTPPVSPSEAAIEPAAEAGQTQDEHDIDVLLRDGFDAFADHRKQWSNQLYRMGLGLDRYLSGNADLDEANQTYVRVRVGDTLRYRGAPEFQRDVKFRLDLQATQKKYRLIFENDSLNEKITANTSTPAQITNANLERQGLSAALSMSLDEFRQWKSTADAGVRGSFPLDPFARHTLSRNWDLGEDWSGRLRSRVAYYNSKGYTYNLAWRMDRMLDPDLAFRSDTETDWDQKDDFLKFGHVFGVTRFLPDNVLLDHAFGVIGSGLSNSHVDIYYFAVTHRQFIYKDWVVLDLVPQVDYARERNFNSSFSFTARFEVWFFENKPF